jgi:hypothetical protein
MTESNQMAQDLQFVRKVVESKNQRPRPAAASLLIWAGYSLFCIPTYDYLPTNHAATINLVGFLTAMGLSAIFSKHHAKRTGEFDREQLQRTMLHWYGGIALLLAVCFGLTLEKHIDEVVCEQVSVILVGFLYFTAGVHFPEERFMRWAGPVIVLAGIGVALLPHFRSTAIGLIFAACLLTPLVFGRRASGLAVRP